MLRRRTRRFSFGFRTLVKVDFLILDDWGPDRFTSSQRRDLMEIVEDRYRRRSTLINDELIHLDKSAFLGRGFERLRKRISSPICFGTPIAGEAEWTSARCQHQSLEIAGVIRVHCQTRCIMNRLRLAKSGARRRKQGKSYSAALTGAELVASSGFQVLSTGSTSLANSFRLRSATA